MGKKPKGGAGAAAAARPPAKTGTPVDPRFAALQTDPRFERFPAPRKAVSIDDRFAGMFKDPEFQSGQMVDKRGRKVRRTKHKEDMRKYYRLQGEDDEVERAERDMAPAAVQQPKKQRKKHRQPAAAPEPESAASSDSSEEEAADDEATAAEKRWAYLRGVGQPSESSSSSSSSRGSSSEGEGEEAEEEEDSLDTAEAVAQWGVGAMAANPAERIPDGTETRRLAAVDLDWERVKAVDIYAALRSFLPAGGRIESVTVYPSDYGLQRMKEETTRGPQGIYKPLDHGKAKPVKWKQRQGQAGDSGRGNGDDSEEEEDGSKEEGGSDGSGQLDSDTDEDSEDESDSALGDSKDGLQSTDDDDDSTKDEVDQTQLRLYERSKLRYYYAIAEFDSVDTATRIYTECDGLEFQLTSCKFDLRFVPDEQSFEGREVRDRVTGVPDDYVAPPAFANLALQHTNVKLTWDADDDNRKRTLAKRVTKDELRDDDFKAYLASESEASEPDEAAQAKYKALLAGGDGADSRKGGKGWGGGGGDDSGSEGDDEGGARPKSDRDMEMELTFEGGLEALGQRLLSKKQEHEARKKDTVWEAYERRRREKRAAAKAQGRRHNSDSEDISDPEVSDGGAERDDPFFQHHDDPFNDPFFQDDGAQQPAAQGQEGGKKRDKAKRKAEQAAQKAATAAEQEAEDRRLAELQLLMMDEGALRRWPGPAQAAAAAEAGAGKAAGKMSKKERARLAKARKRHDREAGSDDEDLGYGPAASHKVDLADPRFVQLYTADDFALDPTDPRFKASESVAAIQRRRAEARMRLQSGVQQPQECAPVQQSSADTAAGDKLPMQAMVASLKRKAGNGLASKAPSSQTAKPAKAAKAKKRKVQHAA